MFGRKKENDAANPVPNVSVIAHGTIIEGNVQTMGDIRIEGKFLGTLVCRARLVVAEDGEIEGNIDSTNATVAGRINGQLTVRESLSLQETARVTGDIVTDKLVVHSGAVYTGNCRMGEEANALLKRTPVPEIIKGVKQAPAKGGGQKDDKSTDKSTDKSSDKTANGNVQGESRPASALNKPSTANK